MRICFVSRRYFPAVSGMSIYAANLLRELVADGHDVTMISQYYDGDHATVYGGGPPPNVPGVKVIGLPAIGEQDGGDFERDIATMVATIKREHAKAPFDILHAQYGYPTGWATLLAAPEIAVPCVVSIQGGDGHWIGSCCDTHFQAFRRVLEHAGALLIGGKSFIAEVADRMRVPRARFTGVPGAVDTSRFSPMHEVGAIASRPRLLYHGRVDRRKGVLEFIEALELLRARGLEFEATISGIGPDAAAAQALASRLCLASPWLRFAGASEYAATPAVYAQADIFSSPTHAEGFSNTILEAMAAGLPVASCEVVGVTDCLRHDDNGLLTEVGDVEAHAQALANLIENAPLRRRIAMRGLEDCRANYSWRVVGRQIVGIYETLRGTAPAKAFERELAVQPCRFREQPHLL